MYIYTVVIEKVQSSETERNKSVFKRDLDDDSDGAHLTSFGIEFQTEEEEKKTSHYSSCIAMYPLQVGCHNMSRTKQQ